MNKPEVSVSQLRRTQRVTIAIPVVVRGTGFEETTSTVTVNAHGGLVMLGATVERDSPVWIIHTKTLEELPGKVVSLGKPEQGKIPVGIEFAEPSPFFWQIYFPPDDWQTSVERKRPGSHPPRR